MKMFISDSSTDVSQYKNTYSCVYISPHAGVAPRPCPFGCALPLRSLHAAPTFSYSYSLTHSYGTRTPTRVHTAPRLHSAQPRASRHAAPDCQCQCAPITKPGRPQAHALALPCWLSVVLLLALPVERCWRSVAASGMSARREQGAPKAIGMAARGVPTLHRPVVFDVERA